MICGCTPDLTLTVEQVLEGTHSQRVANKVRIALQSINSGLLSNSSITVRTMMLFIHSLTADNLPLLWEQKE